MGVSQQFPAPFLSKFISSTFFSRASHEYFVVALVFRVLLVAGLQDDRVPEGREQVVDARRRRNARDVRPRAGPPARREGQRRDAQRRSAAAPALLSTTTKTKS